MIQSTNSHNICKSMRRFTYIFSLLLFHLLSTPALLIVFGDPTKPNPAGPAYTRNHPVYSPLIEYAIFGLTNVIVYPALLFLSIRAFKKGLNYTIREIALSTLAGVFVCFLILKLTNSTVLTAPLHALFCAMGFGAYIGPMLLIAYKKTTELMEERHLIIVPSFITLAGLFASGVCGFLDHDFATKFFPTPAFKAFCVVSVVSDIYHIVATELMRRKIIQSTVN